jgi:hypothetical protein
LERPELVRPELDNFRRALDWAVDHDLVLAFRLAISPEQFWVMNDAFEGVRWFDALLERGDDVPPEATGAGAPVSGGVPLDRRRRRERRPFDAAEPGGVRAARRRAGDDRRPRRQLYVSPTSSSIGS